MTLIPDQKMDVREILQDLENYRPKRRGWVWRKKVPHLQMGKFTYEECAEPLKNSIGIPAAQYFDNLDPQPMETITTEIASGRFEDDIRRMRMSAWHGADHIMVIRTAGQSHFDGLIEGSPQGIGGVPITRKQVRAHRKALDLIEDEVGRPINYHSYISGVAGPDIAVMFAEEGVNGAHQDPQYNVLYRNVNMVRSFIDAAESKMLMTWADIAQIDGAHNANATARDAWKVMPELMVQHGINALFSYKVGMKKENICLSTVPPTAAPAPSLKFDLPYAVALRDFFDEYKMRAQMNTKYITSSGREATVTHVLNMLISRLTNADIQSTITPDEGRNVPWHVFNIEACDTAKQSLVTMDDLLGMVEIRKEGFLPQQVRELKERAILFLEGIKENGGYFNAVEKGSFVDSGMYPERNGDGIARKIDGGVGAGAVYERDFDYMAPVTAHFGDNNIEQYDASAVSNPSVLIDGCTLEKPEKIIYIDELDETDNANVRMDETEAYRNTNLLKPEVEWLGDGTVTTEFFLPTDSRTAEFAALEFAKHMNMKDAEVIHVEMMHPSEGTRVQVKGKLEFVVDMDKLVIPPIPETLSDDEIREFVKEHGMKVVAGTVGQDEHSVGLREVIDIKHGGIEKFGIDAEYLGTSVPVEKLVDAAIEHNADVILASTIISHDDVHYKNMKRIHEYAVEKGVREKLIICAGGTQVSPEIARTQGMDQGFGRYDKGTQVATFLVKAKKEKLGLE
ncbi:MULTISPECIES: D-ornithine 4,5-aminomutase subunit OraE [unclassified Fusibacter]|uniref:D-ornithine 4,5-aminomutase subunit OraE n=1 Tax=unclassified Fusibacter TaxID=2624464 RepID=UPI001012EB88|nr:MULTISPECIES: D-ornithine 4,5-aminomutase subunit OraE [unclassified Fusibacter]MCK8059019.1 D-ornithine 4,5-aminomutase subunit OraE [Fusibacter sp. A2]NPE22430.1 LuxR family transcriptional regulator [Fusibacter sp. A1]RXV60535.1 LuxR family transcriptional regulator [Fusibacter sp. A1]